MSDAFQQLRKRRTQILQQLPQSKNNRLSSAQRRRKIQANINQFHKTMHSGFYKASPSKQKQDRNNRTQTQFFRNQNVMQAPTIKDIINSQQCNLSQHIQTARVDHELDTKKRNQIQDMFFEGELGHKHQRKQVQDMQLQRQQSQSQKCKEILNNKKGNKFQISAVEHQEQPEQIVQDIKKQVDQLRNNDEKYQNVEFMLSQSSQRKQSTPNPSMIEKTSQIHKNKDNKLNQNTENVQIVDKSQVSESNNSSAIFFTSQFHQYISQAHKTIQTIDHESKKQQFEEYQKQRQQQRQENNRFKQQYCQNEAQKIGSKLTKHLNTISQQGNKQQKRQQNLIAQQKLSEQLQQERIKMSRLVNSDSRPLILSQSKSGRSFALSNEESLKYSMNQSVVNQLIHRKLGPQLVLDRQSFYSQQNTIQYFADKKFRYWRNSQFKDFSDFAKIYNLNRFQQRVHLRIGFQELQIVSYLAEQQQKFEVFVQILQKRRNEKLKKRIFQQMKHQTSHQKFLADQFQYRKNQLLLNNTFRVLKMYWYDRKILSQIDRYYLNKIFNHFRAATQKQAKRQNKKALKFYYKSALKRYFALFIQGFYNTRSQRQKVMMAYDHYALNLMAKFFGAWKQRTNSKGGKYISLAMTTKDVFKETADHRWIQTKTLDFKYLK